MKKFEHEKNGLIQSQELLYTKLKRINQLFKIHFSSLTLLFSFSLGFIILLIYLLATGQATTDLAQRYGLFGTIMTVILTVVLFLLIVQMGIQVIYFGLFLFRGNSALKRAKMNKKSQTALYGGIVPYITNFYAFFNRYSKEKKKKEKEKEKTLITLVRTFLFLNFLSGFYVIFLFTRFLDVENGNPAIKFFVVLLFLVMLFFWLMNLMTSSKIKNEIVKWGNLFPKLDEWAQGLEYFSLESSLNSDKEEHL